MATPDTAPSEEPPVEPLTDEEKRFLEFLVDDAMRELGLLS